MAKKKNIQFEFMDPDLTPEVLKKMEEDGEGLPTETPLIKSILNSISRTEKVHRLALEEDPNSNARYDGLFYQKNNLLPDLLLKRIATTDELVADVLRCRGTMVSPFGKKLENRLSYGFRIEPNNTNEFNELPPEKKAELNKKIKEVTGKLFTCGSKTQWSDDKLQTLPTFFSLSVRNGMLFGRFATEFVYVQDPRNPGKKIFHSFRAIDAGTIYKALPNSHAAEGVRKRALELLSRINNEKLKPERFEKDEYAWVQVINGNPVQAFTSEECVVHNCYPCTDIELNGYPITPIDTAIQSITTHINIVNHNKMYFQNGRASKGMLVVQSDNVDASTLADLKQQFVAAINSSANAWRMPVFKVGVNDTITWQPIDNSSRDMEFQYLADSNARTILAAFQMSPTEIPGYDHLSKGSNQQTLSESSNEWKLEAARDVGIRPLIGHLQDFINFRVLHLLDKEVAEHCSVRLHGLEAESAEKEIEFLKERQDQDLTYDELLEKIEKRPIGSEWGGKFPLNPRMQQILDKYFTVGQIKEKWFGVVGASKDPAWNYCRDPFYFQNKQMVLAEQQMQEQQKIAQQQMAEQQKQEKEKAKPNKEGDELNTGIDQLIHHFSKSEDQVDENKKKLMSRHNAIVDKILLDWSKDSETLLAEVSDLIEKNVKK